MIKNLSFIIKTTQDFIRTNEDNPPECDKLKLNSFFEAISDSYIPMIKMFERLKAEGVSFKVGVVLPPVLCSMFENEKIQKLYVDFLDKRIALGKKEISRNKENQAALALATAITEKNKSLKKDFTDTYNKNLVAQFAKLQKEGVIEILGTCATDVFMPYYADLPEAISAQIEMGLQSYKKCFGDLPEGFYLPELGYTPGIEKIIRSYGYSYTVLHSRSILLTDNPPANGIFYPVRIENSLVAFTADPYISEQIYSDDGWSTNSVYRNENRDIGFELELKKLSPVMEEKTARCSTGFKYWKKDFNDESDVSYDMDAALEQAQEDAADFLKKHTELLDQAAEYVQDAEYVASVCCIDEDKIRKHWAEYLLWLESVIKNAKDYDLNVASCKDILPKASVLEKIEPYYSAGTDDTCYGENLLSSRNCWMMRYVRKATERMIDLAERFPSDTGLKTRLLNIGALELLLAQSSSLAKMIEEEDDEEYAERRFRLAINAFTVVFDALGSNTVSTEWLTKLEFMDNLFPWINYKIFSVKK